MHARITGVQKYLPATVLTSADVERRIGACSPDFTPRIGMIERTTGIHERYVVDTDQKGSDLAVEASRKLLAEHGLTPTDVDLIVFAAAWYDVLEPATAHLVAAKLGASCPVFDVTNACNSFLNGIEVSEALLRTGRYRRVLVCAGESPSRIVRWHVKDRQQFMDSFAGYTLGDGGAAMLLEAGEQPGIFHSHFGADSRHWDIAVVPAHSPEGNYFHGGAGRFIEAFRQPGMNLPLRALRDTGIDWNRFAVICVHQPTRPYLDVVVEELGLPTDRLVSTVAGHGNLAAVTLPFQLATAIEQGRCGPGDEVAMLGVASGLSVGAILARL